MSSKDDFIFEKRNLLKTSSGKNILKKVYLKIKDIFNSKDMSICQRKSMLVLPYVMKMMFLP